jgi:hypothetical protein
MSSTLKGWYRSFFRNYIIPIPGIGTAIGRSRNVVRFLDYLSLRK